MRHAHPRQGALAADADYRGELKVILINHGDEDFTIKNGDKITIDAIKGEINVDLTDAELAERKKSWVPRENDFASGSLWKYAQVVGTAEFGAVTHPGGKAEKKVYADI